MATATTDLVQSKKEQVKDLFYRAMPQINSIVPKHMDPERLLKVALVAINKTPKLLDCKPQSLLAAFIQASQLGLDCSGTLGGAYLVPFGTDVTMIIGYRGFIDLARRGGCLESIEARIVYSNDEFELEYGLTPKLVHKPTMDERGDIVGAYCIARLKGGETLTDWMTKHEIDAIRKRSKASNNGPWVTDYSEMARKTVVRRLCKYLPLSPEMLEAIQLSDKNEFGDRATMEVDLNDTKGGSRASKLASVLTRRDTVDVEIEEESAEVPESPESMEG